MAFGGYPLLMQMRINGIWRISTLNANEDKWHLEDIHSLVAIKHSGSFRVSAV